MPGPDEGKNELGRVIYTAPEQMVRLIKSIKRVSLSTTVLSIGIQPILIPKLIASGSTITMGFAGLTCAGIIVSPLLLNWFTKRYVTEMYYNDHKNQFALERLNFINRPVRLYYKAEDVHVPDTLGLFTTFKAKQKPYFIDQNLVLDFVPYKHMLGFDKPIDLRGSKVLKDVQKLKQERQQQAQ